jgi:hypothetical protein
MAEPISDAISDTRGHSPEQQPSANATSANATTRRDFLLLAGAATAGASLIRPAALFAAADAAKPKSILIPANAHPAIQSAAKILAKKLALEESAIATYDGAAKATPGAIVLALSGDPGLKGETGGGSPTSQNRDVGHPADRPKKDGYTVTYAGGTVVWGARPRSLLFAAGEPQHWVTAKAAAYHRNPDFAIRTAQAHTDYPVAEQVAIFSANMFTANLNAAPALAALPDVFNALTPAQQKQMTDAAAEHTAQNAARVKEFHDADVEVFALLPYGNNFATWSAPLYAAVLKAYPTAKGTSEENSHETAALCPSDPLTWKVIEAYVREWAQQTQSDGISATFWDNYGAFCQDSRCKASGLDKFPNELYEFIHRYHALLQPMGQKLHLRTWSSGCPHWLGTNYVHAPGYGQFGLSHPELWGRVIKETPGDVLMQTKVYHSDCEPDARFTTLLGKCAPHTEIVEYQMVGQFIGRQYFPASTVNYTAATMQKSLKLIGGQGGAEIYAGGTSQPASFDIFADIVNGHCVFFWRELAWDVNADVAGLWHMWAKGIYGEAAAPAIATFMRASEDACTWCWSPLGHGSSTNADFAGTIARREVLLRYTNRYYLPEYAAYLEPTLENVTKMEKQKADCMKKIAEMAAALEQARPHLAESQYSEVATRFDWFRHFAVCNTTLDVSLWRFRYLRGLAAKLTTDPKQMKELAAAYDVVEAEQPKLFQFDPAMKMSCYRVPLGQIGRAPNLGNPRSLMHEIYAQSLAYVMESVGPDYLPKEWMRGAMPRMDVPATQQGAPGAAPQRTPGATGGGRRGGSAPAPAQPES